MAAGGDPPADPEDWDGVEDDEHPADTRISAATALK
jgi:hypothetical protein